MTASEHDHQGREPLRNVFKAMPEGKQLIKTWKEHIGKSNWDELRSQLAESLTVGLPTFLGLVPGISTAAVVRYLDWLRSTERRLLSALNQVPRFVELLGGTLAESQALSNRLQLVIDTFLHDLLVLLVRGEDDGVAPGPALRVLGLAERLAGKSGHSREELERRWEQLVRTHSDTCMLFLCLFLFTDVPHWLVMLTISPRWELSRLPSLPNATHIEGRLGLPDGSILRFTYFLVESSSTGDVSQALFERIRQATQVHDDALLLKLDSLVKDLAREGAAEESGSTSFFAGPGLASIGPTRRCSEGRRWPSSPRRCPHPIVCPSL